jgi:hypothetical protein
MTVMENSMRSGLRFVEGFPEKFTRAMDVYFSVDVETDGPIPGRFSMLSFALVYAGAFDGQTFFRPPTYERGFYCELKPIFDEFEPEALQVNGLDRNHLMQSGLSPSDAMTKAARWVEETTGKGEPVFVAYPLSFDWTWMYWYFVQFSESGSPFGYSRCFDIKTAMALSLGRTIKSVGRERIPNVLKSDSPHTHHALDDAISQAQVFANIFKLGSEVVE